MRKFLVYVILLLVLVNSSSWVYGETLNGQISGTLTDSSCNTSELTGTFTGTIQQEELSDIDKHCLDMIRLTTLDVLRCYIYNPHMENRDIFTYSEDLRKFPENKKLRWMSLLYIPLLFLVASSP